MRTFDNRTRFVVERGIPLFSTSQVDSSLPIRSRRKLTLTVAVFPSGGVDGRLAASKRATSSFLHASTARLCANDGVAVAINKATTTIRCYMKKT
ncbi:hypothetical protein MTX20_07770 [Bradyrhizobium sp. ISRA435]|nr:hypothetical protein MTX20_07770 [Bradyrhizobium sp. ISRA435]